MTELQRRPTAPAPTAHRYDRDSLEFARVVALSDGIFAIALTLLVFTLDDLAMEPLVTCGLAFFLVASAWWQHHRIVAQLAFMEPGLIAGTLALLAAVAFVPFPTSLIGADPRSRPAVLAFLTVFAVLLLLCITLIVRAQMMGAWRRELPSGTVRWVVTDWTASLSVHLVCLLVAMTAPLVALVILAFGSPLAALLVARLGPPERRFWF